MANTVKEKYPFLFKDWPCLSLSGSAFICLEILGCNSRRSWSFSDARLDVRTFADPERPYPTKFVLSVSEKFVFRGVLYDLVFNKKVKKEAVDGALENLGNFLTDEQHLKCLKAVVKKPKCEAEVQSALALHLFKPLSGDASTTVDEKVYQRSKVPKECLNCKEPVSAGDTSFGCHKVWYGYGDILLERTLVKIDTIRNEESSETQDYSSEIGSVESKKPRVECLDSDRADVELSEDESDSLSVKTTDNGSYMPYGPGKIKFSDGKQNSILSQVLSQTIVNGFLQVKKFPELQGCFIPSFLASEKYITIHMYNSSLDVLLTQQRAMSLWADDHHDSYDLDTIIALWMALNMHKFSRGFPNEKENFESAWYQKSNFHALTKDELTFYRNSIQRPLEEDAFKSAETTNIDYSEKQNQSLHELIAEYTAP